MSAGTDVPSRVTYSEGTKGVSSEAQTSRLADGSTAAWHAQMQTHSLAAQASSPFPDSALSLWLATACAVVSIHTAVSATTTMRVNICQALFIRTRGLWHVLFTKSSGSVYYFSEREFLGVIAVQARLHPLKPPNTR